MYMNIRNSTKYGRYTLSLHVVFETFLGVLKEPKVILKIDDSIVADARIIGQPMLFDTPKEALDYGVFWVDYLSGSYSE